MDLPFQGDFPNYAKCTLAQAYSKVICTTPRPDVSHPRPPPPPKRPDMPQPNEWQAGAALPRWRRDAT